MVCKSYLSIILSSPTPPNRYTRFISIVSRCGCRFFLFLFVAVFNIFSTIPDYTAGQPRPPPSRARLCGRMVSFSWYCSPCAEDENSYYSNRTKKRDHQGSLKHAWGLAHAKIDGYLTIDQGQFRSRGKKTTQQFLALLHGRQKTSTVSYPFQR